MKGQNFGAGFGAGYASGMATGQALEEEEERGRQRRMSQMGQDQILIKSKADKGRVLEAIASTYNNWFASKGKIYQKGERKISWSIVAIVSGTTFVIAGLLWWALLKLAYFDWWVLLIGSIAVGIFASYRLSGLSEEINYIRVSTIGNETAVLIKKYDNDGYRNIDEDELESIIANIPKQ